MYLLVINASVNLKDINTKKVCLVLFCKVAENSFTVLEEKIVIEEYFHFGMNVQ